MRELARHAAAHAAKLFELLPDIDAGALALAREVDRLPAQARGSWPTLNAATAAILAGDIAGARKLLDMITDLRVSPAVGALAERLDDRSVADAWIRSRMAEHRARLKLPA